MIFSHLFHPAVRAIPSEGKALYLTFDDGPEEVCTQAVLKTLQEENVPATFFLIAQKARKNLPILQAIQNAGHAIGNHSLDHNYSIFFSSAAKMKKWIQESEAEFLKLGIKDTVGFRPPAGIRNPPLHQALSQLQIPLVLWDVRFFDTKFQWTSKKAVTSLGRSNSGSIILLHDRQRPERLQTFNDTLKTYIREAKKQGFTFRRLTRVLCQPKNMKESTSSKEVL